jgi:hypothetical protein
MATEYTGTDALRAQVRGTATWVTQAAAAVVDMA